MTSERLVYRNVGLLAAATFALCMAAKATPFTGMEILPGLSRNFDVQLEPNRNNFSGITTPQLAVRFPQNNYSFTDRDGRFLIGLLPSIWFGTPQIVWTTRAVEIDWDRELEIAPVGLYIPAPYAPPSYAPPIQPHHPHDEPLGDEPPADIPEAGTGWLVLIGGGMVWLAVAIGRCAK